MQPQSEDVGELVSGFHRLQEQVASLRAAVDDAHRLASLGVLAASVSHEINNILTPIKGYAAAALARPDDRQLVQRALHQAEAGAERASAIARSVLALAGHATRNVAPSPRARVRDAFESAAALTAGHAEASSVNIHGTVDADVCVAMDAGELTQVLQNLLLNACTAMHGSGGDVWVVAVNRSDAIQNTVEISVSDNGPGIPTRVLDVLFQPFGTASRGARGGHGLGLAICKGLVESAHGKINVETQVGAGTTFRILVPAASGHVGSDGLRDDVAGP